MKKGLVAGLLCIGLALVIFDGLAGCASPQDQEQLIRESLTTELEQLKNADADIMDELVSSIESGVSASDLAQLETMGLTSQDIVESMLEGFDYTIDSVTVNGNDAVAKVNVQAKNFTEFMTDLTEVVSEIADNPSQFAGMTQDQIMTAVGDKVKEVLANLPVVSSEIDLDYEKEGNTWEPTSGAVSALSSVFFQ